MPPLKERLAENKISYIAGQANTHWNDFVDLKSGSPISVIGKQFPKAGMRYENETINDLSLVVRRDISLAVLLEYFKFLAGQMSKRLALKDVPVVSIQPDNLSRIKPNLLAPRSEVTASWLLWKFPPDGPSEIVILYDESLFNGDTLTRNKLCLHEMGHMVLHREHLLLTAMTKGDRVYAVAEKSHEMEAWWFSYSTLASCAANIAFDARESGSLSDGVHEPQFL